MNSSAQTSTPSAVASAFTEDEVRLLTSRRNLEGLRLALMPHDIARFSFVGQLFTPSGTYTTEQLQPWLTAFWTFHVMIVAALFVYLPHSKLMHSVLAPVIITMNAAAEQNNEELYWPEINKYRETRSPKD